MGGPEIVEHVDSPGVGGKPKAGPGRPEQRREPEAVGLIASETALLASLQGSGDGLPFGELMKVAAILGVGYPAVNKMIVERRIVSAQVEGRGLLFRTPGTRS
ncbi:MAG: hypothetical protein WC285_06120 [Candidatus Gracilibacteria bacterium]|jgi:hypothetical protein